ncbi:MAG: sulfatase-like hydrolase/transferase [Bacteroidota bacterium]
MKKRLELLLYILLSLGCLNPALAQGPQSEPDSKRPNIVLIMCDDLGWGDVGFNGNTEVKTPNLDRLAAKGIKFNRFYSAGPVCSPTRASCLTGRNPFRMGIYTANTGFLKPEEITLPELLKKEGYATGHFGKWHLGTLTTTLRDANRGRPRDSSNYTIPTSHGYDTYFVTESKVPTYDPMVKPAVFDTLRGENLRYGWAALENPHDPRKVESYGTYYWTGPEQLELKNLEGSDSRVIMDRALPFIEKAVERERPFFSVIWFHTPHLPLVATREYRKKYGHLPYKHQLFYASITRMDEQVGRLWDELEALGKAENTMLWFCSDNGPENGTPGSAGPFRARKRSLYEGGVRVPAFAVWPAHFKPDQMVDAPSVTSDYLPTLIDYLNILYPDGDRPLDGISLKPILDGKQIRRNSPIGFQAKAHKMSWVTDRYKLISVDDGNTFELYDLLKDRGETTDIASDRPKEVARLRQRLLTWVTSCAQSDHGKDY